MPMAEGYSAIPLSPLRKVIAARMVQAVQEIPHFRLTAHIEVDALIGVRQALQAEQPDVALSLNDLLIKACATALMDFPAVNLQWAGNEIRQFDGAHISVVIALEGE